MKAIKTINYQAIIIFTYKILPLKIFLNVMNLHTNLRGKQTFSSTIMI